MKSYLRFIIRLSLLGMFLLSSMAAQAQSNLEAWVRRYNSGEARSVDYARKIAIDPDGNIIVAGDTDEGITGADILVIKYSGAGVALWTNRYNGPANGDDRGASVGVDQSGNVFVTGSSSEGPGGTNVNYITFGFSPGGVPLWTNRYDGPANGEDVARALAVDHNGNVFVTGYSSTNHYSEAAVTIAYSGAGVPLWTNRYADALYAYGVASAVTVDRNGNVFVTGSSAGDYATIAYSGAGIPLWTNRYSGGALEIASAIGVDETGNVFVTGASYTLGSGGEPGHFWHCATIAYSPAGVGLWTNRFPAYLEQRSSDLAVDHNGNVFVTGHSARLVSSNVFIPNQVTIAYSGAGVALWTNLCNGPSAYGLSSAIVADHSGNVFVTFGGDLIVAYSNTGDALWTNRYGTAGAYDMAADRSGTVFVTGFDYATIAYSGTGTALWTNRYDGPFNSSDEAVAVAVDQSSGAVFVTGSSSSDYVTIAYSEAGVPLWTNRYDGPSNRIDGARAIAVDRSGKVIVTGESRGGAGSDYATIAYSASGVPLWTNRYDGLNFIDSASAVAVDGSGNVFVTGYSLGLGPGSSYDYATIAYSGAGIPLWTNRYNGPENGNDFAGAVAADKNGTVFVTGSSIGGGGPAYYATVAYSLTGVALWTNRYSGPAATAVAVDHRGHVFVTGYSSASGSGLDYATVAYSSAGMALWTNRYNGPANGEDGARAIAVDHNGNVFVTGYSTGTGNGWDYATIAYSGAGEALWTNRYDGTGNSDDRANAVMVDKNGNVFVTGSSIASGSNFDYATVAYSPAGVPFWTNRYNGPVNGPDEPANSSCLAIGRDGAVYVTGSSDGHYGDASTSDYTTIKYVWQPHLAIQPLISGSSTVNLNLSGPQNSSWSIQRALNVTGPWTNLGSSLIGTNGLGISPDMNPPVRGAIYRATSP